MKTIVDGVVQEVTNFPTTNTQGRALAEARAAAVPKVIDGLVFLSRFTQEEYLAIITAAASTPQLALWVDMLRIKGSITLNGPDAPSAKAFLVASLLLTQQRADEIFAL